MDQQQLAAEFVRLSLCAGRKDQHIHDQGDDETDLITFVLDYHDDIAVALTEWAQQDDVRHGNRYELEQATKHIERQAQEITALQAQLTSSGPDQTQEIARLTASCKRIVSVLSGRRPSSSSKRRNSLGCDAMTRTGKPSHVNALAQRKEPHG